MRDRLAGFSTRIFDGHIPRMQVKFGWRVYVSGDGILGESVEERMKDIISNMVAYLKSRVQDATTKT